MLEKILRVKEEKKKARLLEIGLGVMRVISCVGGQFFFWFSGSLMCRSSSFPLCVCTYTRHLILLT